jgi:hypothetical protein
VLAAIFLCLRKCRFVEPGTVWLKIDILRVVFLVSKISYIKFYHYQSFFKFYKTPKFQNLQYFIIKNQTSNIYKTPKILSSDDLC